MKTVKKKKKYKDGSQHKQIPRFSLRAHILFIRKLNLCTLEIKQKNKKKKEDGPQSAPMKELTSAMLIKVDVARFSESNFMKY